MSTARRRLGDWLDERTGWRALASHILDEPVPGGARWAYVFGSVLVFLLLLQATTGVLIASYYSPSTTTAWASVAYLQDQVTLGWLVRGLHGTGASAMVIVLGLHLVQTALWGAYRRPREMNWIFGVLLLGVTFGFALTGYLLPWDQKGYWATQVATSLAGATPLVGHGLQRLLQGGEAYGNLTLTRFFALHVFVLPAAVALLTLVHVALFRRHGVTTHWKLSDEDRRRREQRFWPAQVARDLAAAALTLALIVAWVVRHHGVSLEAPADPTSSYDARPEWYFLPLFQLLKLFPGRFEVPAALGAPLLFFGGLLALPFIDKGADRRPRRRLPYIALVLALLLGQVGLGVQAYVADAKSESFRAQRERAEKDAARARQLALAGVPVAGGQAVYDNDPEIVVRRLFASRCASCHLRDGGGGDREAKGPVLDGWSSREYIAALIRDPDAPRFFGGSGIKLMKPVTAPDPDQAALVEYVFSLGGEGGTDAALRERGAALFKDLDCNSCHETDGTTSGQGPNLGGWGTVAWLQEFLRDPAAPRFYGKRNQMPRFGGKLEAAEIDALARLYVAERSAVKR